MANNSLNILTDEQLVKMAHEGSATAEELLMEKYKSLVTSISKDYFIAGAGKDDVVQEGMIGLFKAIRGFNPEKEVLFKTFAATCITNQIISAIKKAASQKNEPLNEALSISSDDDTGESVLQVGLKASPENDPESQAILGEIIRAMFTGDTKVFSDMEMQVIHEKIKGFDYREIAETLGRDPKSIDNALQRIRNKMVVYIEK